MTVHWRAALVPESRAMLRINFKPSSPIQLPLFKDLMYLSGINSPLWPYVCFERVNHPLEMDMTSIDISKSLCVPFYISFGIE